MRQHNVGDPPGSFLTIIQRFFAIHRYEIFISFVLFALVLGIFWANISEDTSPNLVNLTTDESLSPTPTMPKYIVVDVSGAVLNPGIYELEQGKRIANAIEEAGGLSDEADIQAIALSINQAQLLTDGQKILIPSISDNPEVITPITDTHTINAVGLISLNNATQAELETLPGIGPAFAQRIIENRPYNSIDQLNDVPGVGDKTYERIKDHVSL